MNATPRGGARGPAAAAEEAAVAAVAAAAASVGHGERGTPSGRQLADRLKAVPACSP
jgi:hypothetical protein